MELKDFDDDFLLSLIVEEIHAIKDISDKIIAKKSAKQLLSERLIHLKEIEKKYQELIFAVETKFPNETRHETALKYITEKERNRSGGSESTT